MKSHVAKLTVFVFLVDLERLESAENVCASGVHTGNVALAGTHLFALCALAARAESVGPGPLQAGARSRPLSCLHEELNQIERGPRIEKIEGLIDARFSLIRVGRPRTCRLLRASRCMLRAAARTLLVGAALESAGALQPGVPFLRARTNSVEMSGACEDRMCGLPARASGASGGSLGLRGGGGGEAVVIDVFSDPA
jgi:hypothetical protein